jgi:PhoD related phosphatase
MLTDLFQRYSVLTDETYELVLERCRREIEEGETKHLLVLLGVPIAYPRLVWLESILTSRAMAPVKALGRAGIFKGGFMNKFDGGVEVLDDLDDHWTATGHKEERNNLIQDLQDLAAEKSIRITILGGDVHLGAVGQFYSNPKLKIPKDRDHRYIPNVISSAIVNTPPPEMLADTLNKRNKVHLFDPYTMEDMIPMFTHDVDGKKRNNKRLLPRRNWCSIREYHPGSTPPPTPPESLTPSEQMSESEDYPPPNRRRFSISREDANPRKLLRRLSQRGGPPSSYRDDMNPSTPLATRRASHDGYFSNQQQPQTAPATRTSFSLKSNDNRMMQPQTAPHTRTSFPSPTTNHNQRGSINSLPSGTAPRPGIFRRPTNLSEKAGKKGGPPPLVTDSHGNLIETYNDHINLEGGLDITLNCEVSQGDAAGITTPYRLLVPALWYDGSSDSQKLDGPQANTVNGVQRKPTLLRKLGFGRMGNRSLADRQGEGNWGQADFSESENGSLGVGAGQADDDQYYEKEKASFGGGTLKRWFSGRKGNRNEDRYEPEYEQPQGSQQLQQRGGDEFVGRELRITPPETQPQWTTPSPSKQGSYGYDATPMEPFPSQARGKAARIMGVDQGPMPGPYSPPAQAPQYTSSRRQPPSQGGNLNSYSSTIPAENVRTADTSTAVHQSQPLPPLTGTSTWTNNTTALPFSPQSPPQRAGAGDGAQDGSSRFYRPYGQGSGPAPLVRGYSGVEAYPGKQKKKDTKGGKLKKGKWYDVGGL